MDKERSGNLYDRIFKENAESIFIPLIELELGIKIKSFKALQEKITKTIEREMDFFYHVITEDDHKMILHIEFQTQDDREMLFRMSEYHGLAFRKHKLPIEHVVIFLGNTKPKMKTRLSENEVFHGFHLINLYELDTEKLLSSQIPEVILLALLSNYEKEQTEAVLRLLVKRLRAASKSSAELNKYLSQLIILSRLRTLEDITNKIIDTMPLNLNYDITQDGLYKKGIKKGTELGIEQGVELGIEQNKKETIKELLQSGLLTTSQIANIMKVSIDYIEKIKSELK